VSVISIEYKRKIYQNQTITNNYIMRKMSIKGSIAAILLILFNFAGNTIEAQTTYYVDAAQADNSGAGTSWATARKDVQSAINSAVSGDAVWVKAGTYLPTEIPEPGTNTTATNRDRTIYLKDGVKLYGSFAGTETALSQRTETVMAANRAIFSGDIDTPGDNTDNCYHVVLSVSDGAATVLDGFTIINGNSNGTTSSIAVEGQVIDRISGGGMYNENSSCIISNCTFNSNRANAGGGVYNLSSSLILTNCTFSSNTSIGSSGGGGMYNLNSNPTLNNCTFSSNTSAGSGGGMYNSASSPVLTSCAFSNNTAAIGGGGINNTGSKTPTLSNCSFISNSATTGSGGGINTTSTLTSFTLTNCAFSSNTASTNGGGISSSTNLSLTNCTLSSNITPVNGGGIYSSGTTVMSNCTFTTNKGGQGGGWYNGGSASSMTKCIFSQDTATLTSGGGAVYTGTGGTFTNCIFISNRCTNGLGKGGGIYIAGGSPPITNCTLYGNQATGTSGLGGGIYAVTSGGGTIKNCILYNNTTPNNTANSNRIEIYKAANATALTVSYSIVRDYLAGSTTNVTAGSGVITSDPLFAHTSDPSDPIGPDNTWRTADDGFELQSGSPAINASDPATTTLTTDIAGYTRSGTFDMGAYEFIKDATLSALSLSSGTLSPTFATTTLSYTASVTNGTTSVTVTPTVNDATATVKVNGTTVLSGSASGTIALSVGSNVITTVVTAQDGSTTKTYTVTVTRAGSSNADLSGLVLSSGTLSPSFVTGTITYTAAVTNATTSITVTPTVSNATATVTVNGTPVASGIASGAISLSVGSNVITTEVTAQDGSTTKTYTVTVTRAASSNANMSGLTLSAGILNPIFASATTSYTASVSNATTSITLTPTVSDASASVTVNGTAVSSGSTSAAISLNVGNNTINTVITAQDGTTTMTYTVTVCRAPGIPTITAGSSTTFCSGGSVILTSSSATGNQWYKDGNLLTGATSDTYTASTAGDYTVVVTSGNCSSAASSPTTVTVTNCSTPCTWTGAVSSDWSNAGNWSCGVAPAGNAVTATIGTAANQPVLVSNVEVQHINWVTGTTISLNGYTLTIDGTITGTGSFKGSASSSLAISGAAGTINFASGYSTLNNLSLSGSSSATLGATLGVYGTVTVGAGSTLNSAGYLNLKSNLSTTGRVGALTTGTITGNVVVERYIPGNLFQAWRLLSVPTQGAQTFRQSWQENQAPMVVGTPGYGTLMGSYSGTGFDYQAVQSVIASVKTWTSSTGSWDGTVTSTSNQLQSKSGYLLYIKGDRSITPAMSTNATNATVLRTTGTLYQGNQSSATVPTSKYAIIGNIYPSAIDFTSLSKDTSATGIYNTFFVWDPKLYGSSGAGAYQTFAKANGWVPTPGGGSYGYNTPNSIIEEGQAFMVVARTTSNGLATVNFAETAKVAHNANVYVRAVRMNRLTATLTLKGHADPADGNTVVFGARHTENIPKPKNTDENFAIATGNQSTSVSARATEAKDGDRIVYNLANLKEGQQYIIEINAENFTDKQAYLEDSYLHTSTPLDMNGKTTVGFTANSSGNGRFSVVFGKIATTTAIAGAGKITVAPNPVTGRTANIQFNNKPEGAYKVTFANAAGQIVYSTTVNHTGNSSTQQVKLPKLAQGTYQMQVTAADGKTESQRIVVSN
jgi:predicted outer membrane repeat protein